MKRISPASEFKLLVLAAQRREEFLKYKMDPNNIVGWDKFRLGIYREVPEVTGDLHNWIKTRWNPDEG